MAESESTSAPTVEYREIPEFPGYRAGSDGTIWRLWPLRGGEHATDAATWHKCKMYLEKNGRLRVSMFQSGRYVLRWSHRLVYAAFNGLCPPGMDICHNDGVPTNNVPNNLRADTHKNNMADMILHGTSNRGERNGASKLNRDQVAEIRASYVRRSRTNGACALAAKYGVSKTAICCIVSGKKWAWLQTA